MGDGEHFHKYVVLKGTDNLICNGCKTVTEIDVLISNSILAGKKQAKIELLTAQLLARELKKDARIAAYAWVRANVPETVKETQGVLL